jgi:SOS-response transcriptional repressor LexA
MPVTPVERSRRAFPFLVWDDRNAPEFRAGDRVVIDPNVKLTPGVMVLAAVGGEPVFARYTQPRKRGSHWACVLSSLNPASGEMSASSKAGDRIVGVMVDHSMPGSSPRRDARCL